MIKMITLTDFQKHEALEHELKAFLFEKITEYYEATARCVEDYYIDVETDDIDCWEFNELKLIIWINANNRDIEFYTCDLPLDILFDPDFKIKMKARFDEERENERLRLLEKRKQHEEEFKRLAEKKYVEELETLRELMKKYPEEVKNG